MNNNNEPLITKEIVQFFGVLLFIVIACPIILVICVANDIAIPDPRLAFWFSAVAGIALLYLLNLITLFLRILLEEKTFRRIFKFKKYGPVHSCFIFIEACENNNINKIRMLLSTSVGFIMATGFILLIT